MPLIGGLVTLRGMTVAVTGRIEGYSRQDMIQALNDMGAHYVSTPNAQVLVRGKLPSGSTLKSRGQYDTILTQYQFIELHTQWISTHDVGITRSVAGISAPEPTPEQLPNYDDLIARWAKIGEK